MERVAGPQLFINCCSQIMPFSKTEEGRGVRVGVGVKVASGVDWNGMAASSVVEKVASGVDWDGMAGGSVVEKVASEVDWDGMAVGSVGGG